MSLIEDTRVEIEKCVRSMHPETRRQIADAFDEHCRLLGARTPAARRDAARAIAAETASILVHFLVGDPESTS